MIQEKYHLPLLGVMLSLGLIISTYLIGDVIRDVRLAEQIIKVRGYAEKIVESDVAIWQLNFGIRTQNMQQGYSLLETQRQQVMAFLTSNAIADNEISLFPVSFSEERKRDENGQATNEIEYWGLNQALEITSRDVHKIAALSTEINQLIKQGIGIQSSSPSYSYSQVNDLKSELLTAATKDARVRAQTLAEGSGVKLGVLRAARQGVFSVRAANASMIAADNDMGDDNTSSISKKITAVVTVDYSMK